VLCLGRNIWAEEDLTKIKGTWEVLEDYTQISNPLYKHNKTGEIWAECFWCCNKFPLEKGHRDIIDNRDIATKRLKWEIEMKNRSILQKIKDKIKGYYGTPAPTITITPTGRILDYEELYACDGCWEWREKQRKELK
jgi:hypothetical protein